MKNIGIEVKWALIFVFTTLLWMLLERALGFHDQNIDKHALFTNFFFIPAVLIYVLALRDKKKNVHGGRMTWKQGFVSGLIITTIVTIFSPLTQWITSTLITPNYFKNVIDYAVTTQEMTQAEAEVYFNLKNYIKLSVISAPILGILTSIIVAFFLRSKKTEQ